jgi:RNA polymerase sigma-70 factor (ECF subfamily)
MSAKEREGGFNSRRWLRWEKRCIARARRGDREAFGELYEAFADPLYARVLMPRLGDRQAADDALAETFRTALERLDRFKERGVSIWYWLARIAANKATDMHRVKSRTGRVLANFEGLLSPLRSGPPDPGSETQRRDDRARIRAQVKAVLERINPRYRRAIELRFFEERERRECAEKMDVKLGTFDVVMLRALRAFRKEWLRTIGAAPEV